MYYYKVKYISYDYKTTKDKMVCVNTPDFMEVTKIIVKWIEKHNGDWLVDCVTYLGDAD